MIVIMGVSGSGKSTVGKILADQLGIPFYDADDFHPPENVEKLSSGISLDDEDRAPWLITLAEKIKEWQNEGDAVLACSALKDKYRSMLTSIPEDQIKFIHLKGTYELIETRLSSRKEHFMDPNLLKSQFDDLEISDQVIQIDINQSPVKIVDEIINKMNNKTAFGIIGMGVMGQNLSINMAKNNVRLSIFNRHIDGKEENIASNFANSQSELKMSAFDDLKLFVESIAPPRNILLMIQAGAAVDHTIESLIPLLNDDDLIIDGGNSNYLDTNRRTQHLSQFNLKYIGVGISGGEEGARKGPSIMPGGDAAAYERVAPYLQKIAARDAMNDPCCTYVGPEGSGHFVKMVHNGIEYAEMQLLTEVYDLLRFGLEMKPSEIADTLESWKNLGLNSYLLEITINILRKEKDDELILDKIVDAASQKGTGGWSTEAAIKLGMPLNTISDAVMARNISAIKSTRKVANSHYGSFKHPFKNDRKEIENELRKSYHAARIINHSIGFDVIKEASDQFNWSLNLSEIARIWTNGCIIRSDLMTKAVSYFKSEDTLLLHPELVQTLAHQQANLAKMTGLAMQHGFPVPVFSSAMNYLLGFTCHESAANLIQAQRDYFGAHTYKRVDKPLTESFHTEWTAS